MGLPVCVSETPASVPVAAEPVPEPEVVQYA
jgi:hypothetical protein